MFLKYLKIQRGAAVIRDIRFRKGINLIIDESNKKITGNGVGKTTVLKLIDFCFGAKKNIFWENPENKKQTHDLVKNYLTNSEKEILISLCLTDNLDEKDKSNEILIERNFSLRNKSLNRVNGTNYITEDSFKQALMKVFFPKAYQDKPTFRQIISHSIRYKDMSLNNTLKTLDPHTSDQEYEALHLFLFGCNVADSINKQNITEKIKQEEKFKKRLEENRTKSEIEISLSLVNDDIRKLDHKRNCLNINENFEKDLNALNQLQYRINGLSSKINQNQIRKSLILEAERDLDQDRFINDLQQLKAIYNQTKKNFSGLQKSFEDLVNYHNTMLSEKVLFIRKELPSLEEIIQKQESNLKSLLLEEASLAALIRRSDTYEQLEELVQELGEKYRQKGEYENLLKQLNEADSNLKEYRVQLGDIEKEQFSEEFKKIITSQVEKFTKHFAAISEELYGTRYALKCDVEPHRDGHNSYKFSTFVPEGPNTASGKKQGEISSFDIAYILFADVENIPCMHFILNDKKELMDDKQLVKIANLANNKNIQFIASILQDKLPEELNRNEYIILKLSEDDKLFKIENQEINQ
ncbi:MAG: DUF2326 domain-containing protein [bacterium]